MLLVICYNNLIKTLHVLTGVAPPSQWSSTKSNVYLSIIITVLSWRKADLCSQLGNILYASLLVWEGIATPNVLSYWGDWVWCVSAKVLLFNKIKVAKHLKKFAVNYFCLIMHRSNFGVPSVCFSRWWGGKRSSYITYTIYPIPLSPCSYIA